MSLPVQRPLSPQTQALMRRLADGWPWPLMLLRADGQLVYANRAGRELLACARPFRRDRQGCVTPARPTQRAKFQEALAQASTGAGAGHSVALRLAGQPRACQGALKRVAGDGPALLLLSLPPAASSGHDLWPLM